MTSVSVFWYKWAFRVVERWLLSATPGQPKEKRKYQGTIRDMIAASSHVLSSMQEVTSGYIAVGKFLFL